MLKSYPCDFTVSPSPFGLDFGTLDFGTSDSGLTIKNEQRSYPGAEYPGGLVVTGHSSLLAICNHFIGRGRRGHILDIILSANQETGEQRQYLVI